MFDRNAVARGLAEAYMDGAVSLPYALLRSYRALKLTDTECMLVIQLLAFRQLEQNEFPTMEQLQERLGCSPAVVGQAMQKLVKNGFVSIDEAFDPITGVQSERYNVSGLFQKIAALLAAEEVPIRSGARADAFGREGPAIPVPAAAAGGLAAAPALPNLYSVFEQEFGRPLTPMECETIAGWLDADGYPEELILFALKESVFAGKLHFRYIDRILLEWSRNRVQNVDEARAHAQKFRGR
ncbi:DnaD domain-containing protein [Cohnella xylanilytica]|uniref:DnaD domain-containing protein n=1 Tax=Cohnella xylanilytica TaxID=557555 RepID=A0A841TW79_9BACL|nr:DnaD domain-containing protein [Cohnella xylanilytica]MBB6690221.1 DnaD domain-containing protein [Cohnella xylanilytica]